MRSDKSKVWADFTPEEYHDAILKRDADSASIAYYLIDKQLRLRLRYVFFNLGGERHFEFQDTIEDFFIYLHDGSSWIYNRPFCLLENVEKKNTLYKWVVMTYRNFMLKKLNRETRVRSAIEQDSGGETESSDDDKIENLSTAIAYADQECVSRNRFVMYRLLLTFLNRSLAIPQEEMAQAVDMQPVAYRVSTKRVKDNILAYVKRLEQGRKLELDVEHARMRDNIRLNFNSLYPILLDYYNAAINKLPNAEAVRNLRFAYDRNNDGAFHEDIGSYGLCNCKDANYLCEMVVHFLEN